MAFIFPSLPLPRTRRHCRKAQLLKCALRSADLDVAIVGGGIGGLAAAIALREAGRSPTVFERAESSGGQAVGLWTNAWRALESLKVPLEELRASYAANEVLVLGTDGSLLNKIPISAFKGKPVEFRYVMRGELLASLDSQLPPGVVRASTAVTDVRQSETVFKIALSDGEEVTADAVIGADGVKSVVRESLVLPGAPRYAGYRAYRGSAMAGPNILEKLPAGRVLQVWGVGERFGATLLDDSRVHWFYTAAEDAEFVKGDRRDADAQLQFVRDRLSTWRCGIAREIADLPQNEFVVTRCGDRLMLRNRWGRGACTLLGDAAHLSTPNLGQGAALALEDAVELGFQVQLAGGSAARAADIESAMRAFERRRWARNLEIGIRSGAVGVLVHVGNPVLAWMRNYVIAPVVMTEKVMLGTTSWEPPPG